LHTIAASCHRPQLKPDAAHNWAFLRGPARPPHHHLPP